MTSRVASSSQSMAMGMIKNSPETQSGFTLIELMVVLTLIAILSALVLPEMRGSLEDGLLRSSSRKLVEILGLANSRAIARNEPHRVRFEPRDGHFQLERQVGRHGRNVHYEPVRDLSGTEGRLDPHITLVLRPTLDNPPASGAASTFETRRPASLSARPSAGADSAIRFYADGTADPIEMVLQDRSGHRLALRVNSITGRVRIIETP